MGILTNSSICSLAILCDILKIPRGPEQDNRCCMEPHLKTQFPDFFSFSLFLWRVLMFFYAWRPSARTNGLPWNNKAHKHMFMAIVSEKVQGEQILFQLQLNSKCPSVMFLILCLVPVGAGTNENGLPWKIGNTHTHIVFSRSAILIKKRLYNL